MGIGKIAENALTVFILVGFGWILLEKARGSFVEGLKDKLRSLRGGDDGEEKLRLFR